MRSSLFLILACLTAIRASAGTIDATVRTPRGVLVGNAVVFAIPEGRQLPLVKRTAVMDQRDRTFVPYVLPVQAGTSVSFPNSDDVQHHVYSFSAAKTFQLPLYKGEPSNPILFDKPGVASLGCNIHDRMSAYIVVVDTPFFGKTDAQGKVTLQDVAPGRYTMHVWYPEMRQAVAGAAVIVGDDRLEVALTGNR